MNKIEIESNANVIKAELEKEVQQGDIQAVVDKLSKLSSLSGLSAELMKHAKAGVLYKQKEIINQEANRGLNPSIMKLKIEAELWEEIALHTYCDRLNAALTHSSDSLRTIISLYKQEMQQGKYQEG